MKLENYSNPNFSSARYRQDLCHLCVSLKFLERMYVGSLMEEHGTCCELVNKATNQVIRNLVTTQVCENPTFYFMSGSHKINRYNACNQGVKPLCQNEYSF